MKVNKNKYPRQQAPPKKLYNPFATVQSNKVEASVSSSSSEKDARICSSESPLRRVIMSDGEEIENDSGAKNRKAETKINEGSQGKDSQMKAADQQYTDLLKDFQRLSKHNLDLEERLEALKRENKALKNTVSEN